MKTYQKILFGLLAIGVFTALYLPTSLAGQVRASRPEDATRACTLVSGAATVVTTSVVASAAPASALDPDTVYIVSCTTATHMATGSTAPTATSNNFLFPAGVFPFRTTSGPNGSGITYIAFIADTMPGKCYVSACQ